MNRCRDCGHSLTGGKCIENTCPTGLRVLGDEASAKRLETSPEWIARKEKFKKIAKAIG